ncbi:MAG TPA: hypothetical protein VG758_04710 [Hyphomicrobiaceae bacterium]|jgi:hypothetical protein|nr:hypothetical protein [Hyphomicrobiaceae bacterium]
MKELLIVAKPGKHEREHLLLEAAEWMGISARQITLDRPAAEQFASGVGNGKCIAAISSEALGILRAELSPGVLGAFFRERCAHILVFTVGRPERQADLFSWLTNGCVSGVTPSGERRLFDAPVSGRRFSGPFAGQTFALERPAMVSTFDLRNPSDQSVQEILRADGDPVFLRAERGLCEIFLLAAEALPDIAERVTATHGVEERFDRLIPLLIFLRHCFGEFSWHSAGSTARLIIDDPLLDQTYGFLDYTDLITSMHSTGYGTSMAFIPWNYRRTSKDKAAQFFRAGVNLSICVHGCDHSNREFADTEPRSLQWKALTALARMERHERRTDLTFDAVMVFPQGHFSSLALRALRANGYLATVNTTCFPTNLDAHPLTVGDFLRPAITKFHGFPIFQRRYPKRLIDFAFDAFLGRPLLIVQHHGDFRDGYQHIEAFVKGMQTLDPQLGWDPLSHQLMRSCMMRSLSEHSMEIRFFTRRFHFQNAHPSRTNLVFTKEEPDLSTISNVLIGGRPVPFAIKGGLLTFEHHMGAGQAIDITIVDAPGPTAPMFKPSVTHSVGVSVRRALSEFRDQTLVRYPRLLGAATEIAARMMITGSSRSKE